jgi:hypothetical protein
MGWDGIGEPARSLREMERQAGRNSRGNERAAGLWHAVLFASWRMARSCSWLCLAMLCHAIVMLYHAIPCNEAGLMMMTGTDYIGSQLSRG